MPDNWGYVLAAYALTAVVLGVYWRRLVRKERELRRGTTAGSAANVAGSAHSVAGTVTANTERARHTFSSEHEIAERSRRPSGPGHPRTDPTTRGPLQP